MEGPANDGTELDGCRALNPSSATRPSGALKSRSCSRSIGIYCALLCSYICIALFGIAHVAADSPPEFDRLDRNSHDRLVTDKVRDSAFGGAPAHFEHLTSLDPSAFVRWVQMSSPEGRADGFLARLYQELERSQQPASHMHSIAPSPVAKHDPSIFELHFWKRATTEGEQCGETELSETQKAVYGLLIPVLVLLSGLFAGLTLGYMSLDETQLQVLALQGTPQQKKYAEKIMPIRKDGHLLLTTLLVANMITNETLPIIADPLLGGGVQAVIVSIVLVVIFAELIPQSVCSRYGLVIGAKLAPVTRVVIIVLWPIAWPVSRILHYTLGAHSGIVYRRAELKELVNLHAASAGRGDLNNDTVTIVGGALDLQEKVVKQAMTPLGEVFMISIDSKLGYETLQQIVSSGHSRIPVYQEIEIAVNKARSGSGTGTVTPTKGGGGGIFGVLSRKTSTTHTPSQGKNSVDDQNTLNGSIVNEKDFASSKEDTAAGTKPDPNVKSIKRKKIIGALLVKQCVLLDPEDETPVRDMVINALPTVPADEPLLNLLNVFQEGRSHLAIVSSRTRRSSPGSFVDLGSDKDLRKRHGVARHDTAARVGDLGNIDEEKQLSTHEIKKSFWSRHIRRSHHHKPDTDNLPAEAEDADVDAEAVATEMAQQNVPIGIITLEDVLEELIGEEILDEYDSEVEQNFATISPPPSPGHKDMVEDKADVPSSTDPLQLPAPSIKLPTSPKLQLPRFNFGKTNKDNNGSTGSFNFSANEEERGVNNDTVPNVSSVLGTDRLQTSTHDSASMPVSGSQPTSPSVETASGEDPTLVAPRANKAVVIRHQAPDGTLSTAIVGESLLRGRTATLSTERSLEGSRSTTPSGSRGTRFKSTPLRANSVPANNGPPVTTPGGVHPLARNELFAEDENRVTSPEQYDDDEHKQLGH